MNIQIFDANKLTMSSLEIAELTGKEHRNVMADIRKMFEELGQAAADFSATAFYQVNNATREREIFNLPKRESLILVSGYSAVLRARIIDRWQELENQQVNKATPQIASALEDDLRGIAFIADNLRISDSGRLGMFTKYCQANAQRLLPALPAYTIDAPIVAGTASSGSSEKTEPITKIVAGITSAAKANQALHHAGLLEQKTRLSRSRGEKRYWCVTELGLEYGKNVTHPNSPLETQPHWYVSKADEIVAIVQRNFVS